MINDDRTANVHDSAVSRIISQTPLPIMLITRHSRYVQKQVAKFHRIPTTIYYMNSSRAKIIRSFPQIKSETFHSHESATMVHWFKHIPIALFRVDLFTVDTKKIPRNVFEPHIFAGRHTKMEMCHFHSVQSTRF